jgi:phosphinothricin acetyltransferase
VIGDRDNAGSIALHRRLGIRHAGTLRAVGFKFGRWVDSIVMQRALGRGDAALPADASAQAPAPAERGSSGRLG